MMVAIENALATLDWSIQMPGVREGIDSEQIGFLNRLRAKRVLADSVEAQDLEDGTTEARGWTATTVVVNNREGRTGA